MAQTPAREPLTRCLLTTALVLLAAAGCRPGTFTFLRDGEITASSGLTRIRHTEHGDMVHGGLEISGSNRTLVSADLDCFVLYIGTRRSESVWVDSLVDHAKGDWPARDGTVNVDVYWAMPDDMKLTEADLKDARLAVENPTLSPSCFAFTG